MNKLDMSEMLIAMNALDRHHKMISYISSLEKDNERLNQICEKLIENSVNGYIDHSSEYVWQNVDIHIISQIWGNTSCGWEGIGGCAMTFAYTTIIENLALGAAFIYYDGELAYITEIDDKFIFHKLGGFKNMPGMLYCEKDLTIIYKKPERR